MGYASPRRMLREASLWEIGIWARLYQVNPWGQQRADQRAAIGHALFANVNRDSKQRPKPYQVRDFMPYLEITEEDRQRELAEQVVAAFQALGRGKGKGDARKDWKARRAKK